MTEIKKLISAAVAEAEGLSASDIESMLEYPPDSAMGDVALPCFKLSKVLHKSPVMIASELKEKLALPEIGRIDSVGGYLNFYVSPNYYAERLIPEILSEKGNTAKALWERERPLFWTIPRRTFASPSISVTLHRQSSVIR